MQSINTCPICGSKPFYTVKKHIDLNKVKGIQRGQYLEYNIRFCGNNTPNECFAICGSCTAAYRALHFTDSEIKSIYTSLYLNMEDEFQDEIIYNNQRLLDESSRKMYEKVKNIERIYGVNIKEIFDIGGRDGFRLVKLADNGYNCTVYDPIQQKSSSEKIHKEYLWLNELKADEKADFIVLCNVLEHCPKPVDVIDDCYKHLNDRGFLHIELPVDFDDFLEWLLFYRLFRRPLKIDVTHSVFFSKLSIEKLLKSKGFVIKKINYDLLPVYRTKAMEILAQKSPAGQSKHKDRKKVIDSNILFLLVNLAKVFPRIAAKIVYKCSQIFKKMI